MRAYTVVTTAVVSLVLVVVAWAAARDGYARLRQWWRRQRMPF